MWDSDGDGAADTVLLDLDDDGVADHGYRDASGLGTWDGRGAALPGGAVLSDVPAEEVAHDWDRDGRPEQLLVDTDGDGRHDTAYLDVDDDGMVDLQLVDLDEDGAVELTLRPGDPGFDH